MNPENTDNLAPSAGARNSDKQRPSRLLTLILGDILVFLIFSAVGRSSHGEAAGLDSILQIVQTAAPFAIGWFVVAPFLGAYKRSLEVDPRGMVRRTLLAWLVSWLPGMFLYSLMKQHVPNYTFFIVSFISITVFLLVWRWPFALANRARDRRNQAGQQD